MWDTSSCPLPQGLRVISYDRCRFVRSSQPTLADNLKTLLDRLELTGVTMVGFSMGRGAVARYMVWHSGARVDPLEFIRV